MSGARRRARFFLPCQAACAMRISVQTLQGTVQLSGFATTDAEKARAAQPVRNLCGVRDVRSAG